MYHTSFNYKVMLDEIFSNNFFLKQFGFSQIRFFSPPNTKLDGVAPLVADPPPANSTNDTDTP